MLSLLFGPPGGAKRAIVDAGAWSAGGMRIGRMRTQAGPVVDEDLALTYAACWCATRLIAETLGGLPLSVYRRNGNERMPATDFYLYDLLKYFPNQKMGGMALREGRTMHQVNWGNGFAEIEWNMLGEVANLWPIHPARVRPVRPSDSVPDADYFVRNNDGRQAELTAADMLHIPGALSEDGIWGKGVIQYARESIGFGIGTERHGATLFGSGAQPRGIVTMPGVKDRDARQNFREEWRQIHGSPDSNEIAILPPEGKFIPITMPPEDSQFLETRKLNHTVIAQWYRVPPHMIADLERATFSNIEEQEIEFVVYSLMPWVHKWEDELNRKLLTKEQRKDYFIEHQVSGLLRGNLPQRMTAYVQAINNGIMTINECRRLENLNGIGPAGDQNFIQLNMTTAQRLLESPDPSRTQGQAAVAPTNPADDDDVGEGGRDDDAEARKAAGIAGLKRDTNYAAVTAARAVLHDVLSRMFMKEAKATQKALRNTSANFEAWLAEFHGKHAVVVTAAAVPAVAALRAGGVEIEAPEIASRCVFASRETLLRAYNREDRAAMAARLEKWPTTMADRLTQQIMAAQ